MTSTFASRTQVGNDGLKRLACLVVGDADTFAAAGASVVQRGMEGNDVGAVWVLFAARTSVAVLRKYESA